MKDVNEMTEREIATEISEWMGYQHYRNELWFDKETHGLRCPTRDIRDAFAVIEKLQAEGHVFSMSSWMSRSDDNGRTAGWQVGTHRGGSFHDVSLPVAICRAALSAIRAGKGGAQ